MSRPEILFPLFAGLDTLEGVGPKAAKAFAALGVEKPEPAVCCRVSGSTAAASLRSAMWCRPAR